jgi:hypothetical protein
VEFRRGSIVAAVSAVLLFTGMGSAFAQPGPASGSQPVVYACNGPASPDKGARLCWNPTGEIVGNCDTKEDGRHPVVYYYRSTSPNTLRRISDAPTYNHCVDHNLANIPESGWIWAQSCNYDGDEEKSCSDFEYLYAAG